MTARIWTNNEQCNSLLRRNWCVAWDVDICQLFPCAAMFKLHWLIARNKRTDRLSPCKVVLANVLGGGIFLCSRVEQVQYALTFYLHKHQREISLWLPDVWLASSQLTIVMTSQMWWCRQTCQSRQVAGKSTDVPTCPCLWLFSKSAAIKKSPESSDMLIF